LFSKEYNVILSKRTIQQYVKEGRAGQDKKSPGPPLGDLSEATFTLLIQAFETHLRLNQVNQEGHKNLKDKLIGRLQLVFAPLKRTGKRIVHQLFEQYDNPIQM